MTPQSDKLICNDGRANPYVLLEFATLELESLKLTCMIASLEEFLISELSCRINLINGTGNKGKGKGSPIRGSGQTQKVP